MHPEKTDFDPHAIEEALDTLQLQVQELQRDVNRSIKVIDTDTVQPAEIPVRGRETKFLGFDKFGKFGLLSLGEAPDEDTQAMIERVAAETLTAANANTSAKITTESTARATENATLTERIDSMETSLETGIAGANTRITQVQTAMTSADQALTQKIELMDSEIKDNDEAVRALILDTNTALSTTTSALAQRATTLEAQVGTLNTHDADSRSRISNIETTFATKTEVEAKKQEAVTAANSAATALVNAESTARSTALAAISKSVLNIRSSMNDQAAGTEAVAQRVTNVEAAVNILSPGGSLTDVLSRVSTLETASATKSEAEAKKQEAISASYSAAQTLANQAKSDAQTYADNVSKTKADLAEVTAKSYADGIVSAEEQRAINDAQAKATAAQNAAKTYTDGQVATLSSAIAQLDSSAQADAIRAVAKSLMSLRSSMGDNQAAVEVMAKSIVDAVTGAVRAEYGVMLMANGKVTGFNMLADNGSNPQSIFAVLADVFQVCQDVNGTPQKPFEVVNGAAKMRKAFIGDADIDTLKIAGNSVIVPATSRSGGPYFGSNNWQRVNQVRFYLPYAGNALILTKHQIEYPSGARRHETSIKVDEVEVEGGQGAAIQQYIVHSTTVQLSAGWHTLAVDSWISSGTYVHSSTISAFSAMR